MIVDRDKRNPNQQKDTVPHESDARGRITCEGHGYQKLVTLGKDLEVRTCNSVINFYLFICNELFLLQILTVRKDEH